MINIILLPIVLFLLFLSSCVSSNTVIVNSPDIHQSGWLSIEERREWQIENILGHFWFEEYSENSESENIRIFLSSSMLYCAWKEFREYRECLIWKLESFRVTGVFTSRGDNFTSLFIKSLKEEISLQDTYALLDPAPYLPIANITETTKCNIITSKDIRKPWSEYGKWIILSYFDIYSWSIESLKHPEYVYLPQWDKLKYYGWNEEFIWHENPCWFYTFGPDAGNILYTWSTNTMKFFWVKDEDGWGSGDFSYIIFAHPIGSRDFTPIGQFYAWSGIVPFVQDVNGGSGNSQIRYTISKAKKNEPFLYMIYTENMRTGTIDTIQKMLNAYIQ